jgi:hypothetical protein
MKNPGLFADIAKAAKDLIEDGHEFDKTFSLKAKAGKGVTFSAESKVQEVDNKGAVATSKIGLKFSPLSVSVCLLPLLPP